MSDLIAATTPDVAGSDVRPPTAFSVSRYHIDLTASTVRRGRAQCEVLEDALGGIARAAKMLGELAVTDPYSSQGRQDVAGNKLLRFNTPAFFAQLQRRVLAVFDDRAA